MDKSRETQYWVDIQHDTLQKYLKNHRYNVKKAQSKQSESKYLTFMIGRKYVNVRFSGHWYGYSHDPYATVYHVLPKKLQQPGGHCYPSTKAFIKRFFRARS